jgi:hypothetical protein
VAIADKLSYCNHCGARLVATNNQKADKSGDNVKPEPIITAMVITFVFGLLAITLLLGVMKSVLRFELGQILFFAALSFLLMLSLEGIFLRLLFRRNRAAGEPTRTEPLAGHTTKELDAQQVHELREAPLSSVTDQTTRAFEPIYTNRNKAN